MRRRIAGVETEYGIACLHNGKQRMSADEIAYQLFQPVVDEYKSSNVFTRNGSRLYLDVGAHPEYATCECDSVQQLLTYIRAGDAELNELALLAEERLQENGIGGEVYLFKNNTDASGSTFGSHENYLIERNVDFYRLSKALLPFLVTRQLICGAGKVLRDPTTGAVSYRLSQRAEHVYDGVSSATTRSRPIINTRDEPLADAERFRRLHVIVGDSNMSEPTTALKLGSTMMMLEMLEDGVDFPDWTPQDPIKAIRIVSQDIYGRAEFPLRKGADAATTSALEVQKLCFQLANKWFASRTIDSQSRCYEYVLSLWGKVVSAIESKDLTPLERDIDWVIKQSLIEKQCRRHNMTLEDPRCAFIDLTYHDIRPGRGIFSKLEKHGLVNRLTTPEVIDEARVTPPKTTRAYGRGLFVTKALETKTPFAADWSHLKKLSQEPYELVIEDPFTPITPHVESLISALE